MLKPPTDYAFLTPAGGWRVTGSRVSLDSVVHAYWEGLSPEAIVAEFSSLSAEQVYGAIAFYLRNREEIDRYLDEQEACWEALKQRSESENAPMLERLRAIRDSRASAG